MAHGTRKQSQEVRSVISQNGFAGSEPVVAQNDIGRETIKNGEREAPATTVIVSGDT